MKGLNEDYDLVSRDMIDKYATFVVRNGPQFEQMTMSKQCNNPRFAFLHPNGPLYDYYQGRLSFERQKYYVQNTPPSFMSAGPPPMRHDYYQEYNDPYAPSHFNMPPNVSNHPPHLQQNQMYWSKEDGCRPPYIQRPSYPPSPQILIRLLSGIHDAGNSLHTDEIFACIVERLNRISNQLSIDKNSLDNVIYKAIDSCTKDNIANARNLIVDNLLSTPAHANFAVCLFMQKVLVPLSKEIGSTEDSRIHVIYLLNDVLCHCSRTREKLDMLRLELESALPILFASVAFRIPKQGMSVELEQYDIERCSKLIKLLNLWKKNEYFSNSENLVELAEGVACLGSDINSEEYHESSKRLAQYANLYMKKEFKPELDRFTARNSGSDFRQRSTSSPCYSQPPFQPLYRPPQLEYQQRSTAPRHYAPLLSTPPPTFDPSQPPPGFPPYLQGPRSMPRAIPSRFQSHEYNLPPVPIQSDYPPIVPPSFCSIPPAEPKEPQYYDLPAGLMCLHINSSDCEYLPIDPTQIQPVSPPSEEEMTKIMTALDQFYEETRTKDGWEPSGLLEFYKEKFKCKIAKQIEGLETKEDKPSRSASSSRSRDSSNSSRSNSRERSPNKDTSQQSDQQESKKSNSEVLKHTMDLLADSQLMLASDSIQSRPLDETNKGHQLLQKMGWSGTGLGKKEQGIVEPISQGEIRDKSDKYKGVGVDNDAFYEFRKSRSQKYSRFWSEKK